MILLQYQVSVWICLIPVLRLEKEKGEEKRDKRRDREINIYNLRRKYMTWGPSFVV